MSQHDQQIKRLADEVRALRAEVRAARTTDVTALLRELFDDVEQLRGAVQDIAEFIMSLEPDRARWLRIKPQLERVLRNVEDQCFTTSEIFAIAEVDPQLRVALEGL